MHRKNDSELCLESKIKSIKIVYHGYSSDPSSYPISLSFIRLSEIKQSYLF